MTTPPTSIAASLGGQDFRAVLRGCAGAHGRPRRRLWPPPKQPACPCGGRDGRLPSRPPTQPAQGPNWDAPATSSGPLRRPTARYVRSRSVDVCLVGSVGRVTPMVRSPVLVFSFWGRVRALGLWVSHSRKRILVSRLFFASLDRSVAVLVRVCRHDSFAEPPLCSSPPLPLVRSRLGSRGDGKRRCRGSALAVTSRACRRRSECAVRVFAFWVRRAF